MAWITGPQCQGGQGQFTPRARWPFPLHARPRLCSPDLQTRCGLWRGAGRRPWAPLCQANRSSAWGGSKASACVLRPQACHGSSQGSVRALARLLHPAPRTPPRSFPISVKALRSLPCVKTISLRHCITHLSPSISTAAFFTLQFCFYALLSALLSYSCEQSSLNYQHEWGEEQ